MSCGEQSNDNNAEDDEKDDEEGRANLKRGDLADVEHLLAVPGAALVVGGGDDLLDAERGAQLEETLDDAHADDDGVLLVEDAAGHDLEDAREDHLERGLGLLLGLELGEVGRELVEQVVDDVGREDAHAGLGRLGLGVLIDRHVEGQDTAKLLPLALVEVDRGLDDVGPVHGADVDRAHGDVRLAEERQQRLERTQCRGLHAHALLLDLLENVGQVGLHSVF